MKFQIMFSMLLLLLRKKKATASEISELYGISTRSVFRYVDSLELSGVPIVTNLGRNGGIYISENFKLGATYFTAEEFSVINESLASTKNVTANKQTVQNIIDKINSIIPSKQKSFTLRTDMIIIDHFPWDDNNNCAIKIRALESAITQRNSLKIEYHSAKGEVSNRIIKPYFLLLKEGDWYVYSFCTLKRDFRLFKVSRIAKLVTLQETFEREPIEADKIDFNAMLPQKKEMIHVIFEAKNNIRTGVEEWLSVENVKPSQSNDRLICFGFLENNDELINKIMSFGDDLRVISPQNLAVKVFERAAKTMAMYEKELF